VRPVLPVDSYLPRIAEALERHRAAVLVAAPGAGKTTRVPPSLVDAGRVLLLQPRRLAARAMAKRIADERGWTVGREVGWHIRFDRQFTRATRLLVVTEGILTAYLQDDPLLSDVATLIVDEFHERSVHADLGLAMARQAWLARTDLRILVMSATLDAAPVAAFLGGSPIIDVPGTLHPMTVDYAPGESIAGALHQVLPSTRGNVLCFLPGAREIAAAIAACQPIVRAHDVELVPLHGSLDASEQDRALSPDPARRRAIVATNVAETSLTVPGVSAVIDSGLQKVARYDADRAIDSLTTERITLDSADQRAGRSARLGPGLVRRLWDARDRLRPHREAEIHRVDLSSALLSILAWGSSPGSFEWFDRPDAERIATAAALLERLGAVEGAQITALGRQMQRLPLPPRLARVLIAASGSFEGAAACAWLSEPGRFDGPRAATSCDLLPVIDQWQRMPPHLRQVGQNLQRAARPLLGNSYRDRIDDTELRHALLAGYPDRVARRRPQKAQVAQNDIKVTLATGHGAVIGRESGVHDADWLIALDVTSGRTTATTEAIVRLASRIEPGWLAPTRSDVRVELNDATGAVKALEIDWYDALPLREHPVAPDEEQRIELLARAWLAREPDEDSRRLLSRLAFAGMTVDLPTLVRDAARSARTLADVVLREDALAWDVRQQLARHAPDRLKVPSGREMTLEYPGGDRVEVAVKLQELFGLADTPKLGPRHLPVTFHLLAPNGRPVQTTGDLRSFWERTYPEVRKELRGRYPKHPWPEDPWTAKPTHRSTRGAARAAE
jgi:ATP-dependent helicase HrpB